MTVSAPQSSRWQSITREPLLWFALVGGLVFGVHRLRAPRPVPASARESLNAREIVVTQAVRDGLAQQHLKRTGQAPTAMEIDRLVDEFVDNEILVAHALELGLDKGDPIIRRRLVQKMDFALGGSAPPRDPTEDELVAWLKAHASEYRMPARWSFSHIFFASARGHESALAAARSALEELQRGVDAGATGDPSSMGPEIKGWSRREIESRLGLPFADAVARGVVGQWAGPIESAHGVHLVRVNEAVAERAALLDEVRPQINDAWRNEQQRAMREESMRSLRTMYRVRIEPSKAGQP